MGSVAGVLGGGVEYLVPVAVTTAATDIFGINAGTVYLFKRTRLFGIRSRAHNTNAKASTHVHIHNTHQHALANTRAHTRALSHIQTHNVRARTHTHKRRYARTHARRRAHRRRESQPPREAKCVRKCCRAGRAHAAPRRRLLRPNFRHRPAGERRPSELCPSAGQAWDRHIDSLDLSLTDTYYGLH